MATKIGTTSLARLADKYQSLAKRADGIRARGQEMTDTLVNTAEVSAMAFGLGMAQGRFGPVNVLGVPVDLGLGLGLHVLAFAGMAGKSSHHLHSFGDGALAAFFVTLGRGVGTKTKGAGSSVRGADGERLSQADLDRLTQK